MNRFVVLIVINTVTAIFTFVTTSFQTGNINKKAEHYNRKNLITVFLLAAFPPVYLFFKVRLSSIE